MLIVIMSPAPTAEQMEGEVPVVAVEPQPLAVPAEGEKPAGTEP
jgi:hypothetical protein